MSIEWKQRGDNEMGILKQMRKWTILPVWAAIAMATLVLPLQAQEKEKEEAEKPTPVTTGDPEVPIDHLKLLVKPLTKEELIVEADGWRDLVKAKVQEIGQQQIAVLEKAEEAKDAEKAEGKSDKATPESDKSQPAKEKADSASEEKRELAETIPELKEEQTLLTDRLRVVVEGLEAKGGEVEAYRQYMLAVSGLDLDVADAGTSLTVIKGWLTSEQGGQRWFWNIVKFLAILAAFYFAASIVSGVVRRAASRIKNASQLLVNFLGKFVKQALMLVGLIVALAALEVPISPMLAAIGAAGFIIAFALQDTLSNFASGLMILAYRPFDEGDVIEAAGVSGVVDAVTLFSTHVRTFDNKEMIVPNNDIWGGTITNATARDTRRVDMVFGIGYDDDIDKAKEILETLVNGHELVLEDPAPTVRMNELGDSSINFICRPWSKTSDYWTVYWDITRAVKEEFDRSGISIPFPQRDIHVYQQTAEKVT
jgi:small conductance mechanosensitive channel